MKTRSLIILTVGAVLAAGLALWLSSGREAATARAEGEALFPGLMDRVNEVEALVIADAGAEAVTLERSEDGWRVVERGGYPADLAKLRRQLIALAEARLVEQKTARRDYYPRLGVEDPGDEGAASQRVTVRLPDGETFSVIVGNADFRGQSTTYVRREGEAQSWAASGDLAMDGEAVDWLAREVIDVPAATVRRVVIEHPDGERLALSKDDRATPNFVVENLPPGRELLAPSSPNSIASALGSLRLEDVLAEAAFDPGETMPVRATFETFDGAVVRAEAWSVDDQRYVKLAFDPAGEAATDPPEDAPGEASSGDADADADGAGGAGSDETPEEAGAQVTVQAAGLDGWVFEVPSYKYSNLTKRLEDLLRPLEDESEETSGEEADS